MNTTSDLLEQFQTTDGLFRRRAHLVEPRGHDEERRGGLVSSRCGRGRQVVALQDILVLGLALVEVVVLPADRGDLKDVAQHLSGCVRWDSFHTGR